MSQILGPNVGVNQILMADDGRIIDPSWGYGSDCFGGFAMQELLWTRPYIVGMGGSGGSPYDCIAQSYAYSDLLRRTGGCSERTQIAAQTLDQNSSPVGYTTVLLLDIPTGAIVDQWQSDGNGYYQLGSPYGAGRGQVVAQRSGSPDLAGASDNNLP